MQGVLHQAIMGDLNTMAHGVARLSANYCCDPLRWRALGWYEAAWWDRHVLSEVRGAPATPALCLEPASPSSCVPHEWREPRDVKKPRRPLDIRA